MLDEVNLRYKMPRAGITIWMLEANEGRLGALSNSKQILPRYVYSLIGILKMKSDTEECYRELKMGMGLGCDAVTSTATAACSDCTIKSINTPF